MMPEKDSKQSKFGRRKFIGHVVKDDPDIDKENTRPIEKQGLVSTREEALITPKNIPRTRRKKTNIRIANKPEQKVGKPLRIVISWKKLKRAIELDRERRRKRIK